MAIIGGMAVRDDEASMATRAAWLHYAGGLTQAEVAKRLGLTSLKAHRLIMKANQEGLVKVISTGTFPNVSSWSRSFPAVTAWTIARWSRTSTATTCR